MRSVKNGKFHYPAPVENILFDPDIGMDKNLVFSSCRVHIY